MAQLPELQEVNSDLQMRTPRLNLEVDREKAAALGLDFQQIESALVLRLRSHMGIDDLRAAESVPRNARSGRRVPGIRGHAAEAVPEASRRGAHPAEQSD